MSDSAPAERAPRASVILRALIEASDMRAERRVRNLSQTGACVDNDGDLVPGMRVLVSMGSLSRIRGEVMWANDRFAGLHFGGQSINLEDARKPRSATDTGAEPGAGWLADINDAYRRPWGS